MKKRNESDKISGSMQDSMRRGRQVRANQPPIRGEDLSTGEAGTQVAYEGGATPGATPGPVPGQVGGGPPQATSSGAPGFGETVLNHATTASGSVHPPVSGGGIGADVTESGLPGAVTGINQGDETKRMQTEGRVGPEPSTPLSESERSEPSL